MAFGVGMPELLVIMVIVVILFGASRLPQIGKGLGEGIRNFRAASKELHAAPEEEEEEKKPEPERRESSESSSTSA